MPISLNSKVPVLCRRSFLLTSNVFSFHTTGFLPLAGFSIFALHRYAKWVLLRQEKKPCVCVCVWAHASRVYLIVLHMGERACFLKSPHSLIYLCAVNVRHKQPRGYRYSFPRALCADDTKFHQTKVLWNGSEAGAFSHPNKSKNSIPPVLIKQGITIMMRRYGRSLPSPNK